MSIKSRLTQKTGDLTTSPAPVVGTNPETSHTKRTEPGAARQPQTGPGQMLAFNSYIKDAESKVQLLEAKLLDFSDSHLVKMMDPKNIRPSKWANRHESSFAGVEFEGLKKDIESAGGNVQPIKVRPIFGEEGAFEIIFGHRRHQACLQLDIQVSAVIEELDDKSLFTAMDRENRQRADLRPYEQGVMYARALDEGLFPSMRKMAEALGIEPGNASKVISLVRLPREMLSAFNSPLDLQQNWAPVLTQALQENPDIVLEKAKVLSQTTPRPKAAEVFRVLTAVTSVVSDNTPSKAPVLVKGKGGQTGSISFNPKKKIFEISLAGVDEKRLTEIKKAIQDLLS